ncbi:MAG: glutamate racemase [Psychrosphaera sp.]|nr:glutamate racemase [Psychrosphaera sp.]
MSRPTSPHIALIDSGIGGFSVLAEIEQKCAGITVSYFMDNLYLPYGELSEQSLLDRLERIVGFLQQQNPPDIIVIACNTASTQSLDFLRDRFKQTFVGVVPAIKPAANISKSGCIGVLATKATVQSPYIERLINDFASHCKVHKLGSSELVHMAELHFWHEQPDQEDVVSLESLHHTDTVVLGCTHFPLIKQQIQSMLPQGIKLVDSGAAIANRVASLLGEGALDGDAVAGEKHLYFTRTLSADKCAKLAGMGFAHVSCVAL